ncbi:dCTP deaminase [Hasllibacter halocynthiae]|uniref:dCTP deaminase n=1 Tax=Hasllibacter halocynthiae TaxID=595589 RepID=A0A2T0X7G3_9RHOB|nr:2'-deoxycytidine 5'-triphosphate deaminase [Hasllibacter halocynthiae]PRY94891.1 dCTP deaminase [Hasllibacter halocynthiae]
MTDGVLPCQSIDALIVEGTILAKGAPITDGQVQPASLDLRLGQRAHRVRASFLAGEGRSVADRLAEFEMHSFAIGNGAVLERGCVYLVPLEEALALPPDLSATCNAKSSTGRLDLLTRVITDDGSEFDRVPPGYRGPLWVEICPRSFSVVIDAGLALCQIRFRRGEARLDDEALASLHEAERLVDRPALIEDGLRFSVDLAREGIVGWRAKPHSGAVDMRRVAAHEAAEFWEPLHARRDHLILDPGAFYILVSREAVHIPPGYAAEMAPYLAMVGEFRVHYAGFFDPGFGHGTPARGVLEVRCHEAPFVLEHGQVVGRLVYERMAERPSRLYGAGLGSNYQGQGLKLSKHFA